MRPQGCQLFFCEDIAVTPVGILVPVTCQIDKLGIVLFYDKEENLLSTLFQIFQLLLGHCFQLGKAIFAEIGGVEGLVC